MKIEDIDGNAHWLVKELPKSLPIDKNRVYCVGYSMGGLGNDDEEKFAQHTCRAQCGGEQRPD